MTQIATLAFALGILGLFAIDRDRKVRTSKALWIPVIWVSIAASRMVSQWLTATGWANVGVRITSTDQVLEGSPFDRYFLMAVVAIAVIVLIGRGPRVGTVLRANGPIVLFFSYCAISTLWSDYPDVAFKRWIKALGDVAMILIILTDRDPQAAVKRFLSRVGFLLIPVSILLIKYYPNLGRAYYTHQGTFLNVGVATGKNELGIVCFLFGVASVWRLWRALKGAASKGRTRQLVAHSVLLVTVMWLFAMANSMTSLSCFMMASLIIVITSLRAARAPWLVHGLVAVLLAVSFSALFLHIGSSLVETMGRDATLTGRTGVWDVVLSMTGNPLFGTGFESFWLGKRLDKIWNIYWWHPNEAHNGYLEVFLDLGWIGIGLLAVVMVTGYRNIISAFRRDPDAGGLRLAYFVTGIAYNFTESAIRIMHPVWIFFLLAAIAVPGGWTRTRATRAVAVAQPEFSPQLTDCMEKV
jgi:exopolysaccharide production protein ExoQ